MQCRPDLRAFFYLAFAATFAGCGEGEGGPVGTENQGEAASPSSLAMPVSGALNSTLGEGMRCSSLKVEGVEQAVGFQKIARDGTAMTLVWLYVTDPQFTLGQPGEVNQVRVQIHRSEGGQQGIWSTEQGACRLTLRAVSSATGAISGTGRCELPARSINPADTTEISVGAFSFEGFLPR